MGEILLYILKINPHDFIRTHQEFVDKLKVWDNKEHINCSYRIHCKKRAPYQVTCIFQYTKCVRQHIKT